MTDNNYLKLNTSRTKELVVGRFRCACCHKEALNFNMQMFLRHVQPGNMEDLYRVSRHHNNQINHISSSQFKMQGSQGSRTCTDIPPFVSRQM